MKFSRELLVASPFAAREVIAEKNARTLAAEILAMSQHEFSAAFRKSPMRRAKLAGLQRNAAVLIENVDGALRNSLVASHRWPRPQAWPLLFRAIWRYHFALFDAIISHEDARPIPWLVLLLTPW